MAFTSADLDALDRAIASGTLRVRFSDGREVTYQSLDAMLRARAVIAGGLAPASDPAQRPGGVTVAEWGGGG